MNWFTATVLQYIAGALLVLCIVLGVYGYAAASQRDVARAERDAAVTTRDAWKGKAEGCAAANAAYDAVFERQRQEQAAADARAAEAAQRAAAAVADAQARVVAAQQQRDDYARRFNARPANCDVALQTLDAVCPMLRGY